MSYDSGYAKIGQEMQQKFYSWNVWSRIQASSGSTNTHDITVYSEPGIFAN